MRSTFPEFYSPTPDDDERFIKTGTVVIDTNVLLDLYRMSSAQREKVLGVFESLKDRLWIPYQVGLEYQRNRMGVIQEQASHYRRLRELHGVKAVEDYLDTFRGLKLPPEVSREAEPLIEPLRQRLEEAAKEFVEQIGELTGRHIVTAEQAEHDDPVRQRLDALFEGRVGVRPDDDLHKKRVQEALLRITAQVPPGYKDGKKDGSDDRRAGDYLLWVELLEHAKATEDAGLPTLLVTNDTKDDWYYRAAAKIAGPRPELVREFGTYSSNGYHQVTLEGLLRLANDHLAADVDEGTIEKASELARTGELTDDSTSRQVRMFIVHPDGSRTLNPEFFDGLSVKALENLETTQAGKRAVADVIARFGDLPVAQMDPSTRAAIDRYGRSQFSPEYEANIARLVLKRMLADEARNSGASEADSDSDADADRSADG